MLVISGDVIYRPAVCAYTPETRNTNFQGRETRRCYVLTLSDPVKKYEPSQRLWNFLVLKSSSSSYPFTNLGQGGPFRSQLSYRLGVS
jgi:hypothetical protein